ncbi:MAG: tetratricopeptide repeat protein [Muribaculaceae bacterium]|nr:tetratricopeptide repeat protein [Muribaculaceae bacterium]
MKFNKFIKSLIVITTLLTISNVSYGAISTDAKLHYNKGIDFFNLGQLEESIRCFREAIDLDPNYIDAYYNLGSLLEYLKQDEAALAAFKQIIVRKPDDYESVYKAAALSKKLGEYEKARMYLALIPKDTMIGQNATQLLASLPKQELQYIRSEQGEEKTSENQEEIAKEIQQDQVKRYEAENPPAFTTGGTYNNITSPTGITTDNEGNLFVAGFSDNTIYKIDQNNKKIVYIKSEKIDGPIGLAMDNDKNIYIANYNKNNVLKVDSNGQITELITDIQNPYCIFYTNGFLFVSSQGSNSVVRYKLNK